MNPPPIKPADREEGAQYPEINSPSFIYEFYSYLLENCSEGNDTRNLFIAFLPTGMETNET